MKFHKLKLALFSSYQTQSAHLLFTERQQFIFGKRFRSSRSHEYCSASTTKGSLPLILTCFFKWDQRRNQGVNVISTQAYFNWTLVQQFAYQSKQYTPVCNARLVIKHFLFKTIRCSEKKGKTTRKEVTYSEIDRSYSRVHFQGFCWLVRKAFLLDEQVTQIRKVLWVLSSHDQD